jgi:hypothetical protein
MKISSSAKIQATDLEELSFRADRLAELHKHVKLHDKQKTVVRDIFERGYKRVFCRKGRKAGGTEVLLYVANRICGTMHNKLGYLIYPDAPVANRILRESGRLKAALPPEWQCRVTFNPYKKEIYFPLTNSTLVILGAHLHESMVGFEFDFCGFDEIKDHDYRAYKNCYPNIASRDGVWMVTGAPPMTRHNHFNIIETTARRDTDRWAYHRWNLYDNPFLPKTFDIKAEEAQHIREGDEDTWKIEWLAEDHFANSRSVLKSFNRQLHVIEDDVLCSALLARQADLEWFTMYDPGYGTCFAVLLMAYDRRLEKLYVLRELYITDRNVASARYVDAKVMSWLAELGITERIVGIYDSAALGFANEARQVRPDIVLTPCIKHKDDEDKYFRILNQCFGDDRASISDSCPNTIFEVESYITKANGDYPDANNHTLDLLRYFAKYVRMTARLTTDTGIIIADANIDPLAARMRESALGMTNITDQHDKIILGID